MKIQTQMIYHFTASGCLVSERWDSVVGEYKKGKSWLLLVETNDRTAIMEKVIEVSSHPALK